MVHFFISMQWLSFEPSVVTAPVFGTILSIPIPLANFGMELTSHSNSDSKEMGGFHWDSESKFSCFLLPYEKEKKFLKNGNFTRCHHLSFSAKKREAAIPLLELKLGHSKNQFGRVGLWNCELTPILFQTQICTFSVTKV